MGRKFKRIGIIGKYDSPNLSRPLAQVISFLVRIGYQVIVDSRAAAQLEPGEVRPVDGDEIGGQFAHQHSVRTCIDMFRRCPS